MHGSAARNKDGVHTTTDEQTIGMQQLTGDLQADLIDWAHPIHAGMKT